LYVKPRKLLY